MLPSFKQRFIAALPTMPPELQLEFSAFVAFSPDALSPLSEEERRFLCTEGLPSSAAPFLSFCSYSMAEQESLWDSGAIPRHLVPIGMNGSGDLLGIDAHSKAVIYFNHDANNALVFVNSTLALFAECLCLYQEHLSADTGDACLEAIEKLDPPAAQPGSMWYLEAQIM
jgi:hypothetical protein